MSLIEEALRRIKDPMISASGKTASSPTVKPAESTASPHSWPIGAPTHPTAPRTPATLMLTAGAVIGLALLLLLGGVSWLKGSLPKPSTTPATAPAAPPPPAAATEPPAASEAVQAVVEPASSATAGVILKESFVLSGVVEGLGEPYAVINGMVVGVNEPIEGATVVRIAGGLVTVRRADGTETVLRVPR